MQNEATFDSYRKWTNAATVACRNAERASHARRLNRHWKVRNEPNDGRKCAEMRENERFCTSHRQVQNEANVKLAISEIDRRRRRNGSPRKKPDPLFILFVLFVCFVVSPSRTNVQNEAKVNLGHLHGRIQVLDAFVSAANRTLAKTPEAFIDSITAPLHIGAKIISMLE